MRNLGFSWEANIPLWTYQVSSWLDPLLISSLWEGKERYYVLALCDIVQFKCWQENINLTRARNFFVWFVIGCVNPHWSFFSSVNFKKKHEEFKVCTIIGTYWRAYSHRQNLKGTLFCHSKLTDAYSSRPRVPAKKGIVSHWKAILSLNCCFTLCMHKRAELWQHGQAWPFSFSSLWSDTMILFYSLPFPHDTTVYFINCLFWGLGVSKSKKYLLISNLSNRYNKRPLSIPCSCTVEIKSVWKTGMDIIIVIVNNNNNNNTAGYARKCLSSEFFNCRNRAFYQTPGADVKVLLRVLQAWMLSVMWT